MTDIAEFNPNRKRSIIIEDLEASFVLFGMLDDYMGRHFTPPVIENFYPAESRLVSEFSYFAQMLLNKEADISSSWVDIGRYMQRHIEPSGHLRLENEYLSWELSRTFYKPRSLGFGSGNERKPIHSIDMDQQSIYDLVLGIKDEKHKETCLMSFLYGAISRYGSISGDKVEIVLANSGGKLRNIEACFGELGITKINIQHQRSYPAVNTINVTDKALADDLRRLQEKYLFNIEGRSSEEAIIWADYNDGPDMMGCPFICEAGKTEFGGRTNRCFPCHICGHYFKDGQQTEDVLIRAEFFGASFYKINKNALVKPQFPKEEMSWFERHSFVHGEVDAPDDVSYRCSPVESSVVQQIWKEWKDTGK
jgi:hypothetical protein